MKPPKRERRPRIINGTLADGTIAYGERWSLQEKKQLLDGLKCCGADNLERIQREFVPGRQLNDIKNFISTLIHRFKSMKPKKSINRAPVEVWLDEAEELTKKIHDYSFVLADIFSVFGNLEPHDNLPHEHAPDWGKIYLFLANLLRGSLPPELSPINATIVLNLLDELAEDMRKMDTKTQRLLMKRKYAILSQAAKAPNKTLAYRWAQTALEKDPFERVPQMQTSTAEASSADVDASQLPDDNGSAMQVDESGQNGQNSSMSVEGNESTRQTSSMVQEGSTEQASTSEQATTSSAQNTSDSSFITEHAQTPSNQNESCDNLANETTSESLSQTRELTKSNNEKGSASSSGVQGSGVSAKERKLSMLKSESSPLYTLNPFCIPVKYLNISAPKT